MATMISKRGVPVLDAEDYIWVAVIPDDGDEDDEIICAWHELDSEGSKHVKLGDTVICHRECDKARVIGTVRAIGPFYGFYDEREVWFADQYMNMTWKNVKK